MEDERQSQAPWESAQAFNPHIESVPVVKYILVLRKGEGAIWGDLE